MRITAKNLGNHSQALSQIRPGTRVYAEGPYGTFTARRRTQRRVLLIGAGVGITPLRSLFETIYAWPGDLALIYRESDPQKVLFRPELEAIAARRNALLAIIVGSRAQLCYDPLSAASLGRIPAIREHDVYLCGPEEMQQSVTKALRSLGVPRRHIHVESFTF